MIIQHNIFDMFWLFENHFDWIDILSKFELHFLRYIYKHLQVCVMPQVFTTDDSEFSSRALGPKSGISTTITRKIWANMEYRCSQIHDGWAPVSTPPRASTNKTPSASQPGLWPGCEYTS